MYILAQVTKWQDNRDSTKRVHARDIWANGYREFLLNPNRMVDIKDRSTLPLALSSFLFFDNHRDRREGSSYVEANVSPAEIQTAHDTAFFSKFITLPFCPKNDPTKTTVDTTLDVDDIAYVDRYNDPDYPDFVWIIYCRKAFRRVEQLVALSLEQFEDIVETGTTSTTTTTTEERQ